jgi:hypothetical protein
LAPAGGTPAFSDQTLLIRQNEATLGILRVEPSLGRIEFAPSQQQAAVLVLLRPSARLGEKSSLEMEGFKVSRQHLDQAVDLPFKAISLILSVHLVLGERKKVKRG